MNSSKLWGKRAGERIKEIARFSKYMFNDHLLFVIIIAIGGGAYYYQGWVKTLTPDFPTALLFGVLFALMLAGGSVITFLKEPDKVYLLPLEQKLKPYFIRSAVLSYIWNVYIVFMALLVLAPIYTNTVQNGSFFALLILLFLLKALNLWVRWNADYDRDRYAVYVDYFIRIMINFAAVFLFIEQSYLLFGITVFIFLMYSIYFSWKTKNQGLPWERLIENEEKRMFRFYRLANLFTDVPQFRNEVKRRKWLDILIARIPFRHESVYTYLLARTFLRSGDYFGLFARLTIIGGLLIIGLDGTYTAVAIAILFLYLTGFQLLSLWRHHEDVIWPDLYPVPQKAKNVSFFKLLLNILWTQNLLFTLLFLLSKQWVMGAALFALLSIFIYAFVYVYSKKRIAKWESEQY